MMRVKTLNGSSGDTIYRRALRAPSGGPPSRKDPRPQINWCIFARTLVAPLPCQQALRRSCLSGVMVNDARFISSSI